MSEEKPAGIRVKLKDGTEVVFVVSPCFKEIYRNRFGDSSEKQSGEVTA